MFCLGFRIPKNRNVLVLAWEFLANSFFRWLLDVLVQRNVLFDWPRGQSWFLSLVLGQQKYMGSIPTKDQNIFK